eukprot:TRINITY_DN28004_c0_g1_i1.p1 TRINITY_DN28004_c0_g1~~TRINITY_DN28004_c0_g1_i1.p1  ORF type:complete len:444 (+),score=92.22 TRINITY_DN28004_c0_g1_i1:62-1333(+)
MVRYMRVTVGDSQLMLPEYYATGVIPIASGSYGEVFRANDANNEGSPVAIKKISCPSASAVENDDDRDKWKRILREIRLMVHFDGADNLLTLRDLVMPARHDYREIYLVMEYLPTDLNHLMAKNGQYFSNPGNVLAMVHSLLYGLFSIHSAGTMHRDLKPANIVVTEDGTPKIADFGLGRDVADETQSLHTEYVVTRWYRAPEILLTERYGKASDVWSLGCILGEMLRVGDGRLGTARVMFPGSARRLGGTQEQLHLILNFIGHKPQEMAKWVTKERPREFLLGCRECPPQNPHGADWFPNADATTIDLLQKMLTWNPVERHTVEECLRHPYFGEFAWDDDYADPPWSTFDARFEDKCRTAADGRKLANLEITRFHEEFTSISGVEIMEGVSLETYCLDASNDDPGMGDSADTDAMLEEEWAA